MRELDTCLETTRKIKQKQEIISEIQGRMTVPKNQIVTDMPRGGGVKSNAMEDYLIRVEELLLSKDELQKELDCKWNDARRKMKKSGVMKDAIELMHLRFYCGLPWRKCAAKMNELYPNKNWNVNKCYRIYRVVLYKTNN